VAKGMDRYKWIKEYQIAQGSSLEDCEKSVNWYLEESVENWQPFGSLQVVKGVDDDGDVVYVYTQPMVRYYGIDEDTFYYNNKEM
jgi:hypothetical protein